MDATDEPDPGSAVLEDFAPGETERFRDSWKQTEHLVLAVMALGPVMGVFVLWTPVGGEALVVADPVKGLGFVGLAVGLYELALLRFFRKNRRLLDTYEGWTLTENGVRFPVRRDKDTKELARRFVPYDAIDAVYFRGTERLVSIVWPTLPDRVRAQYGDDVPRALDEYVVVLEEDEAYTAIDRDDVDDVEALKAALREQGVKVVG